MRRKEDVRMYKTVMAVFIAGLMMLSPVSVFAKGFSGSYQGFS
jgi:hypothetical protein